MSLRVSVSFSWILSLIEASRVIAKMRPSLGHTILLEKLKSSSHREVSTRRKVPRNYVISELEFL